MYSVMKLAQTEKPNHKYSFDNYKSLLLLYNVTYYQANLVINKINGKFQGRN